MSDDALRTRNHDKPVEQWTERPCVDCGTDTFNDELCRECDLDRLQREGCCEECGLFIANANGYLVGMRAFEHGDGCSHKLRRVAIVGCRPPSDADGRAAYGAIAKSVETFVRALPAAALIISGGAAGVDSMARELANARSLKFIEHRPDYATHGRRAPLERNTLIVADADEIHAWPAPWSRGTWDTINKARAAGKPVTVHEVKP